MERKKAFGCSLLIAAWAYTREHVVVGVASSKRFQTLSEDTEFTDWGNRFFPFSPSTRHVIIIVSYLRTGIVILSEGFNPSAGKGSPEEGSTFCPRVVTRVLVWGRRTERVFCREFSRDFFSVQYQFF